MYEIYKILHGIGLLMSVGAISCELVYIWYKKFFPDTKIPFPYRLVSPSVQAGLMILIISGFAMYSQEAEIFNSSTIFWVKMVFVLALIANNVWLNSFLKPEIRRISTNPELASSLKIQKLEKQFHFAENIFLFLWLITTFVSFALPEGGENDIDGNVGEEEIF